MTSLFFSDILRKVNISSKDVKLIRHTLSDKGFAACHATGMVVAYTRHQTKNFSSRYRYWAVFIGDRGNYARFYGLYQVGRYVADTPDVVPPGFPEIEAKTFKGENAYYELSPIVALDAYRDRLIVDWKTRMWHQDGEKNDKEIVALQSDPKKVFPGFDRILLDFSELENIINDPEMFSDWKTALSSVNAVYLISDTGDGRLYVGSAYGKDGLWGRWAEYVKTGGHGHNKLLEATLKAFPDRIKHLRWSVLQVVSKNTAPLLVIDAENQWKNRLLTREHGYNQSELGWKEQKTVLEAVSLLEKIAKTPKWQMWCEQYTADSPAEDADGLLGQLRRLYDEAYNLDMLSDDYQSVITSAQLDEAQISTAESGWLSGLSTEQLRACITWHFRRDHFENGALINSSIAGGAVLRMLLEYQNRR